MTENVQMTLPEAASYLGLKHDSLRRQAGRGVLRAYKKGRDWLVDKDEVERYGRENRRHQ
jgi:excisionase family DNA binding protein